jgi:Protein of unknown function (DUF3040)
MSLNFAERHQLHRMERRLLRSDPHLAGMLVVFTRLCDGQVLPAREQLAIRAGRIRRPAALIAKAIAVVFAAIRTLVRTVDATLTAVITRGLGRPPQPARQQADPGTGGRGGPPGRPAGPDFA